MAFQKVNYVDKSTLIEAENLNAIQDELISLRTDVDDILTPEEYLELATMLASDYSTSGTYFEGQFVIHSGNVYEANVDITTAEAWTASHWDLIGAVKS